MDYSSHSLRTILALIVHALGANINVAHPCTTPVAHPARGPTDRSPALGVVVLPVAGPLGAVLLQLLCVAAVEGYAEGVGSGPS